MAATRTVPATQPTGRPARKSPLRIATMPEFGAVPSPGFTGSARQRGAGSGAREITAADLRQMMISEFAGWLRCQTNRHKRPFQEDTISD